MYMYAYICMYMYVCKYIFFFLQYALAIWKEHIFDIVASNISNACVIYLTSMREVCEATPNNKSVIVLDSDSQLLPSMIRNQSMCVCMYERGERVSERDIEREREREREKRREERERREERREKRERERER